MKRIVGVDVGGTKCAAVLLDEQGTTVARTWTEHQGAWHGLILDTVMSSIEALLALAGLGIRDVDAIGVSVAGLVSRDRSTLVHSPMIRESHLDLGARLSGATGRSVMVDNDANATLYAVRHYERTPPLIGQWSDDVSLLFTLGTGVGGAIMIGDRTVVGEHGYAAELGHITVDYADGRICPCGRTGCVEQFASGRGVEELAGLTPRPAETAALLETLGLRAPLSARDIVAAAGHGDPWAAGLLSVAGTMLGRAIAILCVALDPTTVTIGGSFGHAAWRWLLPTATREMRDRWTYATERPVPTLALDSIGPYAAAIGAALRAADNHEDGRNG